MCIMYLYGVYIAVLWRCGLQKRMCGWLCDLDWVFCCVVLVCK